MEKEEEEEDWCGEAYRSGLGSETSMISPKGMKASWRVCCVTWLSRPPMKMVAFWRDWSDILVWCFLFSSFWDDRRGQKRVFEVRDVIQILISREEAHECTLWYFMEGGLSGARGRQALI